MVCVGVRYSVLIPFGIYPCFTGGPHPRPGRARRDPTRGREGVMPDLGCHLGGEHRTGRKARSIQVDPRPKTQDPVALTAPSATRQAVIRVDRRSVGVGGLD